MAMSLEQQQWRGDGGPRPDTQSQPTVGWLPSEIAPCFLFLVRNNSTRLKARLPCPGGAGVGR